jgi:hypothetical protein
VNQTRLGSLMEACVNVCLGFGVNYSMNLVILNGVMGMGISLMQNLWIGLMFTVVSVIRSYGVRRLFNMGLRAALQKLAKRLATCKG